MLENTDLSTCHTQIKVTCVYPDQAEAGTVNLICENISALHFIFMKENKKSDVFIYSTIKGSGTQSGSVYLDITVHKSVIHHYLGLDARKRIFSVSDQVRLEQACSSIETYQNVETLHVASLNIIHFQESE